MPDKEDSEKIYVAFDGNHKDRGKINENYSTLRDTLNNNNFVGYNFLDPLTYENLRSFDIFVLACPDFSKLSRQEISSIERWVLEDGGGLLLLSHAGGDKGRNSNLSELSERFGIAFENDQVLDATNNLGFENLPIIHNFRPPHPVSEGISSLCYRAGCSLTIIGTAFSITYSNETSEPFSCPLICVAQPEKGKVCAIGSYEMFRNDIGGGFDYEDHSQLALNVFNWLVSDARQELKSKGLVESPELIERDLSAEAIQTVLDSTTNEFESTEPNSGAHHEMNIDFDIKISSKSELIDLLYTFSKQIDKIQKVITKLLKIAVASEDEIAELQKTRICVPPGTTSSQDTLQQTQQELSPIQEGSVNQEDIIQSIVSDLEKKAIIKDKGILSEIKKKGDAMNEETERTVEELQKDAGKTGDEKLTREELQEEKKNLENRKNSITYLMDFIQKKFESEKLEEESYKSQSEDLKEDLKKLNKRIKEIDKFLEDL